MLWTGCSISNYIKSDKIEILIDGSRQLKTVRRATSVGQFPRIFTISKFTGRIHFQYIITVGYQLMLQKTFKPRLPISATGKGEVLMEYCSNEWWQHLSGQSLVIGRYESHLPDSADVWTQASQEGPVTEFKLFIRVDPYTKVCIIKFKEQIKIRCMWTSAWDILRRREKGVHNQD